MINMVSHDPGWFKRMSKLSSLTISCLASRPERVGQRLSVYLVVRILDSASLDYVRIKDVYLEHDVMSRRPPIGYLPSQSVHLENLKATLVEALFHSEIGRAHV